ncbi:MAG: hypothetical protein LUF00_09160 [Lachnospiraceae bacterium]|nr:hypothetical protein [Lachnospiraceae bacterium]
MADQNTGNNNQTQAPDQGERIFSQLEKANEKAASLHKELDQLKNANAVNQVRAKISKETGVPAELLTGDEL